MNTPNIASTSARAHTRALAVRSDIFRFERLTCHARADVLMHFSSLSPGDLALRFSATMTAASLERYAAALDFGRDVIVAARDGSGAVVGIAQLMPFASDQGKAAEIAFSVTPAARGCGLGKRLMEEAIGCAHAHGVTRLVAQICPENAPMLAVLRGAGMSLTREDGEIVGTLIVNPPSTRGRRRDELRVA
jgi:RimJ/RimL family protein N-acetyltransferase